MADVYLTAAPATASLSHIWRTSIRKVISEEEERWGVYTWPRIRLEYTYKFRTSAKLNNIKAKLSRFNDALWGAPIWPDLTLLNGEAEESHAILPVESFTHRHFYEGRQVIIIDPLDLTSYEVGTILSLDEDSSGVQQIILADTLESTWSAGAYVLPLYEFRIDAGQTLTGARRSEMTLSIVLNEAFEAVRDFTYTIPTPAVAEYLSIPLFLTVPKIEMEQTLSRPYDLLQDIGLGVSIGRCATGEFRWRFSGDALLHSREEVWDFLEFFDSRQGRLERFWAPTGADDLELSQAVGPADTIVHIKPADYATNYFGNDLMGRYVFIKFPDKSYVCRKIAGTSGGADPTITLDAAISKDVGAMALDSTIVSFLFLCRWDSDSGTIEYTSPKPIAAKASIALISLAEESLA